MDKTLQAYFSGRVQGVGFRAYVYGIAKGYQVTGWVKNLRDGRVELVASGNEAELSNFLNSLREGEMAAHIHEVKFDFRNDITMVANMRSFEIR